MDTIIKDSYEKEIYPGQIFLYAYPIGSASAKIHEGIVIGKTKTNLIRALVCDYWNQTEEDYEKKLKERRLKTTTIKHPCYMIILNNTDDLPNFKVNYLKQGYEIIRATK